MSTVRRLGILGSFGLALTLAGCGLFSPEKATPEPEVPEEYKARISPGNVLFNLALAHRNRDIDNYRDQMDEQYLFIPNPEDPEVDFEQLTFPEDQESTENMFNVVDKVEMRLDYPAPQPSDRLEYPAEQGYQQILVSSVRMDVTTREIIDGEPLILQVAGDPATFIFVPDSTQTPVTWKIVFQQDDS